MSACHIVSIHVSGHVLNHIEAWVGLHAHGGHRTLVCSSCGQDRGTTPYAVGGYSARWRRESEGLLLQVREDRRAANYCELRIRDYPHGTWLTVDPNQQDRRFWLWRLAVVPCNVAPSHLELSWVRHYWSIPETIEETTGYTKRLFWDSNSRLAVAIMG